MNQDMQDLEPADRDSVVRMARQLAEQASHHFIFRLSVTPST